MAKTKGNNNGKCGENDNIAASFRKSPAHGQIIGCNTNKAINKKGDGHWKKG